MYLVAEKMSSNLRFSTRPSARGQLLSSWWTKMTFSNTAYTPRPTIHIPTNSLSDLFGLHQ